MHQVNRGIFPSLTHTYMTQSISKTKSSEMKDNWWTGVRVIGAQGSLMPVESEGNPVWSEKCNAAEKLNADYNRKLSEHTVHHNLLCMWLHSHRQVRVSMMILFCHRKHLKWAHECQNWTNWSNGKKLAGLMNQFFFLDKLAGRVHVHCLLHFEKSFQTKTCHFFCIIYQTDHEHLMNSLWVCRLWVCCLRLRL